MKRNTLCIVFLLAVNYLFAQDCNKILSGRVIDFHDGVSLEGATITFNSTTIKTDSNGMYKITGLCATSYAFTISHEDCNSQVVTININEVSDKDFYLEHHLSELQEVKVSGKNKTKTSSSQEETINKNIIDKYSSATLGDALREIPGVSSLNTGSTIVKPIIQGLSGSRVLILNNNVRMQDMEWGEEHAPNVDINTAGNVTVVKGASALKYGGDAIGGIIIMESNRVPAKDTLFGKTIVTGATNGRGGTISSEIVKGYHNGWFVKGQGTLKRFGDFEAPDYVLSNTGVSEKGGSVAFGINKFEYGLDAFYSFYDAEIGVLASSHIGNPDDLFQSINSGQPDIIRDFTYDILNPRQEVTHHLGKVKYYRRFEELGKWTTQYDFQNNQRFEFDTRRTDDLSRRPSVDLELTTHTLTSDFNFDANNNYSFNAGVMLRYQNNFADALETGVRRLIPDYDKYDFGAFITGELEINESLILEAGIRYDFTRVDAKKFYLESRWDERGYEADFSDIVIERGVIGSQLLTNPIFDYHNISSTVGIQYLFKEDYQLRANYTLSQRPPNPAELFSDGLHHSAARIEIGDLRFNKETSHKFSTSILKNNEKWGWEIAPYVNFIKDYILLEPVDATLTIRGPFPVWEYRQTNALLLGFDAKMYVHWSKNWQTDHNFSLVKGKETDDDIPLINMPAPNFTNKIVFTEQDWFNLQVSLESQYTFRQNEFPPNIFVFSQDAGEEIELKINTPPDAYHLLSFDTNMGFKLGEKNDLKVGLTINNLLNKRYRNYLNRQRNFADDLGRNFLLRLTINY
ncbi:TonB-dependent receptor [Aquimarina sp. BL5]|uniref:TonB-dependent receptor n=1 Tax=Aquimarina sp. BL5 TaxID=1714860 RepID=UPI000E4C772F|nr:TonB-dependent receptor [Aquimarina sp. BL5]AXT52078.1 TonB-dependent receptor [Aquimarina sp. BL5]RKN11190.1 TonB-dependent receptor [Aquimarina sp. BL5]